MAITTLDRTSALVLIDLQRGISQLDTAPSTFDAVVGRAAELADAFRARELPVVVVTVDAVPPGRTDAGTRDLRLPPDWAESIDEFAGDDRDLRVVKKTPGAFIGTPLHAELVRRGVTQVVVCGVSTSVGVEMTVREAYELGYHVTVPLDACTDTAAERHTYAAEQVLPRCAETGATDDVLAVLASWS